MVIMAEEYHRKFILFSILKFDFQFIASLRAAEIVEYVRKYMNGISQNLLSLSPY